MNVKAKKTSAHYLEARWRGKGPRASEHWKRQRRSSSEKLMKLLLLVLTLSILLRPAILPAQTKSLAEVAERERQRRERLGSASRVFTNVDLNKYRGPSESSSGQGRESKPSFVPVTSHMREIEEEFVWSQRFIEAKRRLLEAQIRSRRLQATLRQENVRAILLAPAGPEGGGGYGPYGTFETENQMKKINEDITSVERELEDLREQLRKSGQPASWERSLLALSSSETGESVTPGLRDSRYWQAQLSLIDNYYNSLIDPLKGEMKGDGEEGNTYPDDLRLLVKELDQKREQEKAALAERAILEGALPGWFR